MSVIEIASHEQEYVQIVELNNENGDSVKHVRKLDDICHQ